MKPWEIKYSRTDELAPAYPYIQWVNNPRMLEPHQSSGGFARPTNQDIHSPGVPAVFHHGDGHTTEVVFSPELTVAILASRSAWVKDHLRLTSYTTGARKKLQVVCLLQLENGVEGPIMLTFMGLAGSRFQAARYQFAQQVRQATKGKAPAYAFWATFKAGQVEMVGRKQKSPITNVVLARKLDPDRDFIGATWVDYIDSLWTEIDRWSSSWQRPGLNGEGVFNEDFEEEDSDLQESDYDPTDPASWYSEGTWEWAMLQVLPFDGKTAKAGTPLHKLGDEALEYISKLEEYPTVAKAARILLRVRREPAPSELGSTADIPF